MAHSVSTLETAHQVDKFCCGQPALDTYLKVTARQHQDKDIARTYVLTDDDAPDVVIGFVTVAIRRMTPKGEMPTTMAKRLPSNVPGYTLARLAVDKNHRHQCYGADLLMAAMAKAKAAAMNVGGVAVFVDAKDAAVASFYIKYGFTPFPSNPLVLAIPVKDIPQ